MSESMKRIEMPIPYEPLTEHLAKEQMAHIEETYGTDPHVVMANLQCILHEYGHDCLQLGINLVETFPHTGVVDMMEAYTAGIQQGKIERGE